jgi:hypothetical protein
LVQLSVTMQMSLVPDSSCDTYAWAVSFL